MKAAVVVFPGSNCDTDCFNVLRDVMKIPVEFVWHKEGALPECDLVVLPGGFSYGDYLRTGAIARFSPVMRDVKKHADSGRLVLGICNGFQILLEAGLLPGAMLRNESLSFICKPVWIRVENSDTPFTRKCQEGQMLQIPIAHGEGNYYCDDDTYQELQDSRNIIFRYGSQTGDISSDFNPNGSRGNIAGITNSNRNILGMMPHPERASDSLLAMTDGLALWESLAVNV